MRGGVIGTDVTGFPDLYYLDSCVSGGSGAGTPANEAEMKTQGTYTEGDWDFSSSGEWKIDPAVNDGYPFLRGSPLDS